MSVFIDWLSVSQEHAECPIWGSTRRVEFALDSGELHSEVVRGDQVQGSWDSGLHVRATGLRVEVSGNPSRWGRLDNLFGLSTMAQCIDVYNRVLKSLDLPIFELRSICQPLAPLGADRMRDGPVISQVHVTRNLAVGRGGVAPYLDWLSAQSYGRLPYNRTHATTVSAGHVARRKHVSYDKASEIREHSARWRRSRSSDKQDQKSEADSYLTQLADWCDEVGIVRDEVKLGRKYLPETGYRYPEKWTEDTAAKLHSENSEISTMNAGAMSNYGHEVYERLRSVGHTERQARSMANAAAGWLAGQDWSTGLGVRARQKYAKALRETCGLDLRRPANMRALATAVKPVVLEARELDVDEVPDWYRWPAVA